MARKPAPDDKRPEDVDPQHILNQARGFLETYRLLRNPFPPGPTGEFKWYPTQAIVLGAFALELFLKHLLALEHKPSRDEHRPSVLFAALAQGTQERIARGIAELGGTLKQEQLKAALAEFDRTFVTWRYVYEKTAAFVSLEALDGVVTVMDSVTQG
jgi:hypothetical protein